MNTKSIKKTFVGNGGSVNDLVFSEDGKSIGSVGADKTVRLWTLSTRENISQIKWPFELVSVAISSDGSLMAAGDENGVIILWEVHRKQFLGFLFDQDCNDQKGSVYHVTSKTTGFKITYTLPCGSPIPPGAVCVCNCVESREVPEIAEVPKVAPKPLKKKKLVSKVIPVPGEKKEGKPVEGKKKLKVIPYASPHLARREIPPTCNTIRARWLPNNASSACVKLQRCAQYK